MLVVFWLSDGDLVVLRIKPNILNLLLFTVFRLLDPIRHRCVGREKSRNHSGHVVAWVHYHGVVVDLFKHHHGGHPSKPTEQTAQERRGALPHTVSSARRT